MNTVNVTLPTENIKISDINTNEKMINVKNNDTERFRMEQFLSSVQNSGYRMAQLATKNTDDALELVQESMLQLVKRYKGKPDNELRILFYRILSSRITDWYRKKAFRRQFKKIFSAESYSEGDPIQQLASDQQLGVDTQVENNHLLSKLTDALQQLSTRQHQAFVLRAWQGFNVKETATIMKCSTGSVKTHYSRALLSLKKQLGDSHEFN